MKSHVTKFDNLSAPCANCSRYILREMRRASDRESDGDRFSNRRIRFFVFLGQAHNRPRPSIGPEDYYWTWSSTAEASNAFRGHVKSKVTLVKLHLYVERLSGPGGNLIVKICFQPVIRRFFVFDDFGSNNWGSNNRRSNKGFSSGPAKNAIQRKWSC